MIEAIKSAGEEYASRLDNNFSQISAAIKSGKSTLEIKLIIDGQGHTGASWLIMKAQIISTFSGEGKRILKGIKRIESVKTRANGKLR